MHATDFLPILNTSRMLFCALANCTIRWDPTRSVAIMEFCCNPFFLQSCELYGSGATLWQTGKFLAWILGSELWASFMQCVILVRGFQWAKLTSANTEWLYLPHSHKKKPVSHWLISVPSHGNIASFYPFPLPGSLWHEVHGCSLYREGTEVKTTKAHHHHLLSHTDGQWALMKAQTIPQGDVNELFGVCAKSARVPWQY